MDNKPITHYERIISQPVNEFANWLAGSCGMQSESEKRNLLEWLKEGGAIKQKCEGWKLAFTEEENVWECSECGEYWLLNDGDPYENQFYYCPKCGAQMIGGDDDA